MKRFVLIPLLLASLTAVAAQRTFLSATALGLNGVGLSGGVTSAAIPLRSADNSVVYTQASFTLVVTKGTSSTLNVTCAGSTDGTNYGALETCSGSTCTARTWSYDLTTQTSFVLNVPANYQKLQCTFTDPGAGTGTIVATAILGAL